MSIERSARSMAGPGHGRPKAAMPLGDSLDYAKAEPSDGEARRVRDWARVLLGLGAACLLLSVVSARVALPRLTEMWGDDAPLQPWGRPDRLPADTAVFLAVVVAVTSFAAGVALVCSSLADLRPRRRGRRRRPDLT